MDRESQAAETADAGRWQTLVAAVRRAWLAWAVFAVFGLAGPVAVRLMFPEASPWIGLVGGVLFGGYAALCAVPGKFFE